MDLFALYDGRYYVFTLDGRKKFIRGLGVLDTKRFFNLKEGEKINIFDQEFIFLRPNIQDILSSMERREQIVHFKDIGTIIYLSGIHANSRVVEIGAGSGFLTISLIYYSFPGIVYSYDLSRDVIDNLNSLIQEFNLEDHWTGKVKDGRNGIDERNVDAVIVDIPDPWNTVHHAYSSLKINGTFIAYVPNISQVQILNKKLRDENFKNIETREIIERKWIAGDKELRPENTGIMHTSFIVSARKLID